MKFISSNQGVVALHVVADEVIPERGILPRDLIEYFGAVYNFSISPVIEPNSPPQLYSNLYFQMGKVYIDGELYPISALGIVLNGDIISAQSTEIAEKVASDFIEKLDSNFGYRMLHNVRKTTYMSGVVVKFDIDFESKFTNLKKILKIINGRVKYDNRLFRVNKLGFGSRDAPQNVILNLDGIDNADFTIERRAGSPLDENWYFSSAPLKLADHLEVLSEIEDALR